MRLRPIGLTLSLLATGLTLAACSPASRPTAAVAFQDGHVTILARPCPEQPVERVSLTETGASTAAWILDNKGAQGPLGDLPAFEEPDGWQTRQVDEPLSELTDTGEYRLSVDMYINDADDVTFTLAQVRALAADEVISYRDGKRNAVMTLSAFEKQAADSC